MTRPQGVAEAFARLCPDLIEGDIGNDHFSLQDIVVTGLEGGYEWFGVHQYKPDSDGTPGRPWAIVSEYPDNPGQHYWLDLETMRTGLERWIDHLLDQEVPEAKIIRTLQDMDLNDADAVLQMATWGEVRYG